MNLNNTFLSIAFFLIVLLASPFAKADDPLPIGVDRPNVVFILADDLGWRDLSNEGSKFYESPHIDRIANGGMKFTRGYATCQVCSPSRASIMTGKYPARLAITDWIGAAEGKEWKQNTVLLPATYNHQLPADDTSIAEAFREGGYRTFFAGKWHLGGEDSLPTDHGFEFNVGGHHGGSPPGGYFSPWNNPQMKSGPKGELLPLRLGRETAEFIESHKDEPFFAMLSFYSVHGPIQTTKKLWKKYRDKAISMGAELDDERFFVDRTTPVRQVQDNPIYGGMVESMDDAVGIVMAKLDELGLAENTIVVFTSDNGGVSAGDGKATANLPLRGGKGRQWEGGIREPYYIMWPKKIAAGSKTATPATGADLYPTLLELTGQTLRPDQHVDGVSLVPLFENKELEGRKLYWHYPHYGNQGGEPSSIVIDGDWKLIHYYEDGRDELYNIAADVGEQSDIAADNPEVLKQLRTDLDQWLGGVNARMPIPNPDFSIAEYEKSQLQIRNKQKPQLEKQGAKFLEEGFAPRGGWWEDTGK